MNLFATRLRALRQTAGLTQAQLSQRARVPLPTLRNLEQGHRADPRLSTVVALARALGVELERLAG